MNKFFDSQPTKTNNELQRKAISSIIFRSSKQATGQNEKKSLIPMTMKLTWQSSIAPALHLIGNFDEKWLFSEFASKANFIFQNSPFLDYNGNHINVLLFLQRTFTCLGRTHHSASLKSPLFEGSSLREYFRIPQKVGFFGGYELSVIASDSFLIWSHKGPIHKAFADHDSICPLFCRHFQVAIHLRNKKKVIVTFQLVNFSVSVAYVFPRCEYL